MRYLLMTCFYMGILDTDPITTGGVGGAPATPSTTPPVNHCADPGSGLPKYDIVVLNNLYGDGDISRTEYNGVLNGVKSIEDLSITPAQLSRLRCSGSGEPATYDVHFDPGHRPSIGLVAAGLTADFTTGHEPTDKAHKITITNAPGAPFLAAVALRVTFANVYEDEDTGAVVAPLVFVAPVGGAQTWRIQNITAHGYDLFSDSGIAAATTVNLQVLVEPARR